MSVSHCKQKVVIHTKATGREITKGQIFYGTSLPV